MNRTLRVVFVSLMILAAACLPAAAQDPSLVDLGLITVKDKDQAQDLRSRLAKGESFEALARRHSIAPAATRGGRLGQVPIKRLRIEYRQALQGLGPNQPSQVILTEEGYSILMRFESAPAASAQAPKSQGSGGENYLAARQKVMAGIENLLAGQFQPAEKNFSQAVGLNPHEDSAPFFQSLTREALKGTRKKEAVKAFSTGFLAMLNRDGAQAKKQFGSALQLDPGMWQARLFQAMILASEGPQGAKQAHQLVAQVLKDNPKSARAHLLMGNLERDQGKLESAAKSYQQTLAIAPDLADAHYQLGSLALKQKNMVLAERELRAALVGDPYREEAHNDLGLVYFFTQRIPEAEASYKKALELNPSYALVHVNLGNLYAYLKKYNRAVDEFVKALALDPDMPQVHNNLAAAYILVGEWSNAIKHADLALKMGFPVPQAILRRLEPHRSKPQNTKK